MPAQRMLRPSGNRHRRALYAGGDRIKTQKINAKERGRFLPLFLCWESSFVKITKFARKLYAKFNMNMWLCS